MRAGWPEAEEAALRNRSGALGCELLRLRPTVRAQAGRSASHSRARPRRSPASRPCLAPAPRPPGQKSRHPPTRTHAACGLRQDRDKPYPINWLRNRGIACVRTSHYFAVDVDFWPSRQLRALISAQLPGWGGAARALVVPNFQRNGHGCRNDERNHMACRQALAGGELSMPDSFEALQARREAKGPTSAHLAGSSLICGDLV